MTFQVSSFAALLIFGAIGVMSRVLYRDDARPRKSEGVLPGVSGAKLQIRLSFYLTWFIAALSLTLEAQPWWLLSLWHSGEMRFLGVICALIGAFVFASGKTLLGQNYTPCFDARFPQALVDRGIYRYIRHPIYTGNLLIFTGIFAATGSAWLFPITLMMVVLYRKTSRIEERALMKNLPGYRQYLTSTGRFFPKFFRFG